MKPRLAQWLVAAVGLLLAFVAGASPTAAQTPGYDSTDGCAGSWQQQFGVWVLVLDCRPGYATEHDRAYMYARTPVDTNADWRQQMNFDDATWLFDAGARGKVSLLIDFRRDGDALSADFYDDQNQDGEIRYGFERGHPKSMESRWPTMRVLAPAGWWVRNGIVNYNLKLLVDGPILASWGGEQFSDMLPVDGYVDISLEVFDTSGQGRPRWEVIQAGPRGWSNVAAYGIFRSMVMVNEADDELTPSTYILWPHLGYHGEPQPKPDPSIRPPLSSLSGAAYRLVKGYNSAHPPIQVDWTAGRIRTIGEFVASRGRAHNWFTYSALPFRDGETKADFENPFAFYDLSGRNDGFPDLQIRVEHYPEGDPFALPEMRPNAQSIRYSWDREHDHSWDYKVGLYGTRPMPSTVDLGNGVRLDTVPYADLPRWAIENRWDAADFVATERPTYNSTEGVYESCGVAPSTPYYLGIDPVKPAPMTVLPVPTGMRCEYAAHMNGPIRLYVGAVDRKLHMVGAEAGLWTLPPQVEEDQQTLHRQYIQYAATDGEYVDTWEKFVDGIAVESLRHMGGLVIHVDSGGVTMARGPASPALEFVKPPMSSADWQAIGAQLARARAPGDGADLAAVFAEFPEERVVLPGVTAWGFQKEADGFRFMALLPEAVPDTDLTRALAPGTYRVTYRPASGFSMQQAAPAQLELSSLSARGDPATELLPTRLAIDVRNTGDEAVHDAPVIFFASRGDQAMQVVGATAVDVLPGETVLAEADWIPAAAGDWHIQAIVPVSYGSASERRLESVLARPATDVSSVLTVQGLRPLIGGAVSASLTLAIAIAVGMALVVWRRGDSPTAGVTDRSRS